MAKLQEILQFILHIKLHQNEYILNTSKLHNQIYIENKTETLFTTIILVHYSSNVQGLMLLETYKES